eukprot:gene861-biopygen920
MFVPQTQTGIRACRKRATSQSVPLRWGIADAPTAGAAAGRRGTRPAPGWVRRKERGPAARAPPRPLSGFGSPSVSPPACWDWGRGIPGRGFPAGMSKGDLTWPSKRFAVPEDARLFA